MKNWEKEIDSITVLDNNYPDHTCDHTCLHDSSGNTFDNAFLNSTFNTDKTILKRWVYAALQQVDKKAYERGEKEERERIMKIANIHKHDKNVLWLREATGQIPQK